VNTPTNLSKSLVGSWELVSGFCIGEDQTVIDYAQAEIKSLKVLSEGNFSFVTTTRGTFYAAGAGDYTVKDGLYLETPKLASHDFMVGKPFEFQYKLDGDTWENSRWVNGIRIEHEIWRRVL
jgi:hypothetical protein